MSATRLINVGDNKTQVMSMSIAKQPASQPAQRASHKKSKPPQLPTSAAATPSIGFWPPSPTRWLHWSSAVWPGSVQRVPAEVLIHFCCFTNMFIFIFFFLKPPLHSAWSTLWAALPIVEAGEFAYFTGWEALEISMHRYLAGCDIIVIINFVLHNGYDNNSNNCSEYLKISQYFY